jgi:hypothetical protein
VSSRQGATLASACPPASEQTPVACAKQGENCSRSYLSQQQLDGCCSGLVCNATDSGVRLCQPGTADEIAAATQCARAASSGATSVMLEDAIQTVSGPVSIGTVYVGLFGDTTGPGGCLVSIVVTLDTCDLTLGPARDATGAYMVSTPSSSGFCDLDGLGQNVTGTATFSGFACEGSLGSCYAGTFEFRLTSDRSGSPTPVLTGAPFHVSGTFCPVPSQMSATCSG